MATSFLKPLKVQGGTFYTFASAAKDISKTFTDDNARFVFSKYALLELPNVKHPSNFENSIVWQAMGADFLANGAGTPAADDFTADNNFNFAQAFQSYPLNFEQLVLNSENNLTLTYDETLLSTTCERIFWKWLKNCNGIRWTDANTINESNVISRFKEGTPPGATVQTGVGASAINYNNVVKYLGDIEIINQISKGGQSYSEIYIHVPTSHGGTPLVLWKTSEDDNYQPNEYWSSVTNTLYGRDNSGTLTPYGLHNDAFFDADTAPYTNSYRMYTTFGSTGMTGVTAYIGPGGVPTPVPVLIPEMDGIQLDWNPDDYNPITKNSELTSINDFNASPNAADFKFNSALIYYDVYDVSNPSNYARNLYGILVIDDYENGVSESKLKHFNKFKPNAVTKLNGNSYGLKLNLKFDTSVDNAGVETVIREDLTFGMDLFADASVRLQESADMFVDQKLEMITLQDKVANLEQYYFSQATIDEINANILALQTSVNNAELNFSGETTILDLIRTNSSDINEILTGKVNVNLQYNTDVIQPGPGIIVDNSVPNQIEIANKVQNYYYFSDCLNTSGVIQYDLGNGNAGATANGNRLLMGEYTNYYRNAGTTYSVPLDNITINLDDTNFAWEKGQTLRIVFREDLTLGAWTLNFRTDALDRKANGIYGILVGSLTVADLTSTRPIIDIICTDAATYTFIIDVIK